MTMLFIGSHATRTSSGNSQRGIFISPRYQLITGIIYRKKRQFKRAIPACQGQKPRARHGQRKLAATTRIKDGIDEKEVSGYFRKAIRGLDDVQFDKMITFLPKDELKVSYKPEGGRCFIPLSSASAGQKTTAILTFILAYGNRPLLLDQPEDDLDNRLVYDLVVKRLKNAKQNRQIIVVTHNANIPVNGDAEYITSMDSDSRYIKIKAEGTLDNEVIRKEICDVMEGTEYAFGMRAKKYHLNIVE